MLIKRTFVPFEKGGADRAMDNLCFCDISEPAILPFRLLVMRDSPFFYLADLLWSAKEDNEQFVTTDAHLSFRSDKVTVSIGYNKCASLPRGQGRRMISYVEEFRGKHFTPFEMTVSAVIFKENEFSYLVLDIEEIDNKFYFYHNSLLIPPDLPENPRLYTIEKDKPGGTYKSPFRFPTLKSANLDNFAIKEWEKRNFGLNTNNIYLDAVLQMSGKQFEVLYYGNSLAKTSYRYSEMLLKFLERNNIPQRRFPVSAVLLKHGTQYKYEFEMKLDIEYRMVDGKDEFKLYHLSKQLDFSNAFVATQANQKQQDSAVSPVIQETGKAVSVQRNSLLSRSWSNLTSLLRV